MSKKSREDVQGYPADPAEAMPILVAQLAVLSAEYQSLDQRNCCSVEQLMKLTGAVAALTQAQFGVTMEILQGRSIDDVIGAQKPQPQVSRKKSNGGSYGQDYAKAAKDYAQAEVELASTIREAIPNLPTSQIQNILSVLSRLLKASESKHLMLHMQAEARYQTQLSNLQNSYGRRLQDLEARISSRR